MGIDHTTAGIMIYLPTNILEIKFGCNGLEAIMILLSGIFAYPGVPFKDRVVWILGGYIVLTIINNIRIAFLAYMLLNIITLGLILCIPMSQRVL